MGNAIQLAAMKDLADHIKDMETETSKVFVCPPDFSNEKVILILTPLIMRRGITYGIMPGAVDNEFIIYTSSFSIQVTRF